VLKDIPVINKILPRDTTTETDDLEAYYGYTSLEDAVDQIRALELELQSARTANDTYAQDVTLLKGEVERLKTFEDMQKEFEKIRSEFYEQVVYAENGPGPEEYRKYYEAMDPATAEYLYQLVVKSSAASAQMQEYAAAYAAMKPEEAAAIFNTMGNSLELVGEILWSMTSAQRGAILAQMDPDIAAQVTRLMDPE
jgi:flagellar motility protein MotE (MotC chaperone)